MPPHSHGTEVAAQPTIVHASHSARGYCRPVKRIGLVILALSSGPIGLWATFAPKSFYEDFPGGGRHWVQLDGPYNHHLVTDFGALNLALTSSLSAR